MQNYTNICKHMFFLISRRILKLVQLVSGNSAHEWHAPIFSMLFPVRRLRHTGSAEHHLADSNEATMLRLSRGSFPCLTSPPSEPCESPAAVKIKIAAIGSPSSGVRE